MNKEQQNQPVGHNEVTYPREIPTHSVSHIISHFRGQETLSLPDLGQHAATVIGCSCELMKSQPVGDSGPDQPHGNPRTLSNEALADILESECNAVNAPQSSVNPVGAFPAWLIPILIEAAIRIFSEFQKKQPA